MPGLAEVASVMMAEAQRRIDLTARNVSNMNTAGYRAGRVFSRIVEQRDSLPETWLGWTGDVSGSSLKTTGNPLDLATDLGTVLLFRNAEGFRVTRSAQLRRDSDGRLVDGVGGILQASGGGDVIIGSGSPTILSDGTVLNNGQAEAKIGLFSASSTAGIGSKMDTFDQTQLPAPREDGLIHQGMVVPANVDLGTEMVELSRAGRLAETGAKVFQVYDDLLGKAATKLAEMGA